MTQFLDKAGLQYYTSKVKQGMEGKISKSEELTVLYGTDNNGEQVTYKAGENITFKNKILPDEYTEVEYIKNTNQEYIDTGITIDMKAHYDEAGSSLVEGVDVEVSPKGYFAAQVSTCEYVNLFCYNDSTDGNNKVRIASDLGFTIFSTTLEKLSSDYGVTISGDIHWGSGPESEDCTRVKIIIDGLDDFTINTEVKPSNPIEEISNGIIVIGSASISGNYGINIVSSSGGVAYEQWSVRSTYSSMVPATNIWTKINLTSKNAKNTLTINGESTSFNTSSIFTIDTLTLFADNREAVHGMLYSRELWMKRITITKNEVVAFEGVPCVRKSDNIAGMYDLVSETFMPSLSTTDFIAGDEVVYPTINSEYLTFDESETAKVVQGFENDEYVQLAWLESEGDSAVDLGITPLSGATYEVKFKVSASDSMIRGIYGNCSDNAGAYPVCSLRVSGNFYSQDCISSIAYSNVDSSSTKGATMDLLKMDQQWHTYRVTPNQISDNGDTFRIYTSGSSVNTAHMALFGIFMGMGAYSEWTLEPQFKGKIEYFDVIYNEKLLHHFIMVRRKSDNVVGVYDTIYNTFHQNQGGSDFIAGNEFGNRIITKKVPNVFTTLGDRGNVGNTIDSRCSQYGQGLKGKHNTLYGVETSLSPYAGATLNENTLIGYRATLNAPQGSSTVIGSQASDSYGFGTVIGAGASSEQNAGTVVGSSSSATATGAIAIGHNTKASGDYGINIGNSKANQGNQYSTAYHTISVGYGNQPSQTYGVAVGDEVILGGSYAIGIGYQARPGQQATSIGYSTLAGMQSTAIGYNAKANEQNAVAIGNANARMDSICIASGSLSSNSQKGSVCIGRNANAWNYGVTIGYNGTNQNGDNSVVIGNSAVSQGWSNVAIGDNAKADLNNIDNPIAYGIAIGFNAVTKRHGAIQIGQGTNEEDGTLNIGLYSGKSGTHNNYKLLDFDGTIPYGRLSLTSPADKQALTYDAETDTVKWSTVEGGGGEPYTLPTATQRRLGGIKVGNGLSVKTDGTLSVDASATGGYGISYDGGFAESVYLISQTVDGGSADTKYTPAQVIDGGRANL